MNRSFAYRPTCFFLTTFFITCVAWFAAAYISYQPSLHYLLFPLILGGMSSPAISAMIMFLTSRDKNVWSDFCQRLRFDRIKLRFIPLVLLFMPCLILLAITISLVFGFGIDQFSFSPFSPDQVLEGQNFLVILLVILVTCSLEEIGWRGYGIDSLNSRFNLWKTSLIFAAIWSIWHVPAFFIKDGYFQQEIWHLGMGYVITYFMSLVPITFLINWLYIKNNRSILIAILFHAVMNFSYSLFQIQPFTKIIIMLLLLAVAAIVVIRDKEMFFKRS